MTEEGEGVSPANGVTPRVVAGWFFGLFFALYAQSALRNGKLLSGLLTLVLALLLIPKTKPYMDRILPKLATGKARSRTLITLVSIFILLSGFSGMKENAKAKPNAGPEVTSTKCSLGMLQPTVTIAGNGSAALMYEFPTIYDVTVDELTNELAKLAYATATKCSRATALRIQIRVSGLRDKFGKEAPDVTHNVNIDISTAKNYESEDYFIRNEQTRVEIITQVMPSPIRQFIDN